MLNKQKQQQIVCLINCETPEHDLNFLKQSGGSSYAKEVFWNPNFYHKLSY